MQTRGFTLVEVTISMSILSIISLLSFIILQSTTESTQLAEAKSSVQSDLREVMSAITTEVQSAYTERLVARTLAPKDAESISVNEAGDGITFQVPVLVDAHRMVDTSTPIIIQHTLADTETTPGTGRPVLRIQDGNEFIIAAARSITLLEFELLPHPAANRNENTRLRIRMEAEQRYGAGHQKLARAVMESTIQLQN